MTTRIVFALLFLLAAPIRAVGFPQTAFQSTSAYRSAGLQQPVAAAEVCRTTGSLSAISASNFDALNGEGGACYSPVQSAARRGRGDEGGAIGEYDFQSPVGGTPWLWILTLSLLFCFHRRREKREMRSEELGMRN